MTRPRRREVFLIGLDRFHRNKLGRLSHANECAYHALLAHDELVDRQSYNVDRLMDKALSELRAFAGPVDAVVAYMDFPASTMVPVLCRELGLPSASLESVLCCEHKYWSRLEQSKVVPDAVPRFALVDPFSSDGAPPLPLPLWLKPIKSWGSFLGFRIANRRDYGRAIETIGANIGRVAKPFNSLLRRARLPAEVADVDGYHCIAEEILSGRQCTLEGYVLGGQVRFYGAIDSIRYHNRSTFSRYEYPSRLPRAVLGRMQSIVEKAIGQIGLDRSAFNAELLWSPPQDHVALVEINTRVAQHHGDLFEKVDGRSNLEAAVEVALGREPQMLHRRGQFGVAAVFFRRELEDGLVTRVPHARRIREIERRFPSTVVHLLVRPGMRLSQLVEQDSYSYACAMTYVGARDHRELLARYSQIAPMLDFRISKRIATPRTGMPARHHGLSMEAP